MAAIAPIAATVLAQPAPAPKPIPLVRRAPPVSLAEYIDEINAREHQAPALDFHAGCDD